MRSLLLTGHKLHHYYVYIHSTQSIRNYNNNLYECYAIINYYKISDNGINVKVFATLEKQNLQELGISFGGKRILTSLVPIIRNAIRH